MKLFVSVETVPPQLKCLGEGSVQHHPFLIDIDDDKVPQLVKEAVYAPTEEKFIINCVLMKGD